MSFPNLRIGHLNASTPIVQGGMGVGISLSGLSSAVANEGGIGVLAAAMIGLREPDVAKNPIEANTRALALEIKKARAATSGILGVNIMVALTTFKELVRSSIEERADIIFSGAGLPLELPKILHEVRDEKKEEFKTLLVPIVSSARAAKVITKKWLQRFDYLPDAFVLEGPKAGGHLGFSQDSLDDPNSQLEVLIPEIVEEMKVFEDEYGRAIPVIAAGGIYTGADIAKFIKLGASGVQMGTRFVATNECDANIKFKESYVNAREEDITIIKSPVGMPGRALKNSFIESMREGKHKPFKCVFKCISTCDSHKAPYCIASALINATKGNLEKGFAFCGSNVTRISSICSVKELIASLEAEYDSFMAGNKIVTA